MKAWATNSEVVGKVKSHRLRARLRLSQDSFCSIISLCLVQGHVSFLCLLQRFWLYCLLWFPLLLIPFPLLPVLFFFWKVDGQLLCRETDHPCARSLYILSITFALWSFTFLGDLPPPPQRFALCQGQPECTCQGCNASPQCMALESWVVKLT